MTEICVIIPVYNADYNHLTKLLECLKMQTNTNFDTYLVLDGDDKAKYKPLKEIYDIHIIGFKENLGAGMTRQRGLDSVKSQYKYVTFIDADDLISPILIDSLYRAITKTDSDIAYSDILRQLEDGRYYKISVDDKDSKPITWMHGKMYKIDYLRRKGIKFKSDLRLNEDIYFNYLAFNLTKKLVKVQETTYYWLYNYNSTTTKDKKDLDYIKYNIKQSILCSNYCIIDLAKRNNNRLEERILAARLASIYAISQEALYYNIPLHRFKKLYKQLNKEIDIQTFVFNNQEYFTNLLTTFSYNSDAKPYLYRQSFITFITQAYNI